MRHVEEVTSNITAKNVKQWVKPELYYNKNLNGEFGKHSGKNWFAWNGLCPFHQDKSAGSFFVNKETGAYRCFSCGEAGGDIISFHEKTSNLSFYDTLSDILEVMRCKK